MSVSLSPIYEHFSETLSGLSTIRALRDTARFTEENEVKLDDSQRANFAGRLQKLVATIYAPCNSCIKRRISLLY